MSTYVRRAQREAEFDKECELRRLEDARKDALRMWDRIEEADASEDVKDILHRIVEQLGIER